MAVQDNDEWDDAYHTSLVRYITVQKELLELRRTHETEVGALQAEHDEKESKLAEAAKTVEALSDTAHSKQEKVKQLNAELSEVQEMLLETERDHKKLSKKLSKLRATSAKTVAKASETKVENDKMREELKAYNRKLAGKQTDLIGRRHQVYVAQQTSEHIKGEELDDLEPEEKAELKVKLEAGLAKIEEFMGEYVERRRAFLTEAMSTAARDMEFEAAAEYKADLMALSEKYDDPDL
eukprot:TRINITY_DN11527_c0_g1_i1.p1 TRINITY_DN11527_c0_g1~~TRINITY_DN11527_c0_g1_i1.p1  ORF type:complete len:238 (-),score=87.77 TRINITY_DN11527_c0_g1_i1:256-969(-)